MPEDAGIRQPGSQARDRPLPGRRRASHRPALSDRLSFCHWLAWPPPMGRAVRASGDAVGAGWLAKQAIVSEGQEAWRD